MLDNAKKWKKDSQIFEILFHKKFNQWKQDHLWTSNLKRKKDIRLIQPQEKKWKSKSQKNNKKDSRDIFSLSNYSIISNRWTGFSRQSGNSRGVNIFFLLTTDHFAIKPCGWRRYYIGRTFEKSHRFIMIFARSTRKLWHHLGQCYQPTEA